MAVYDSTWLALFGAPSSGKGTTGLAVKQKFLRADHSCDGFCVSEDLLKGNPEAEKCMREGEFAPDQLVNTLVREKLTSIIDINKKILFLDGVARTLIQWDDLSQVAADLKCRILPVYINTPLDVCFDRSLGRKRSDDAKIQKRFKDWEETLRVIHRLQGQDPFIEVVGNPDINTEGKTIEEIKAESIEQVAQDIIRKLAPYSSDASISSGSRSYAT
jgi:adenylate kinase family enzyme